MDAEPFISQKDIINELLTAEPSAWKDPFLATCLMKRSFCLCRLTIFRKLIHWPQKL